MCLGVPGCIEAITGDEPLTRMAKVGFSGVSREVSLAYVPEARVGDHVLVHVGFALQIIDEMEAQRILDEIGKIEELSQEESIAISPPQSLDNHT